MSNKISNNPSPGVMQSAQSTAQPPGKPKRTFGKVLSGVADVALGATSAIAPMIPGGQLVGLAARGIANLKKGRAGTDIATAPQDQVDKMWQMQSESQAFNMQYLQLQTQLQSDNRNFSTLSNLMKARHDTAKSAINNMHA